MSRGNFLRSTSFRLVAWYAVVFGVSVAVLLLIVYWTALAAIDQQIDDSVLRETELLVEIYRTRGVDSACVASSGGSVDLRRRAGTTCCRTPMARASPAICRRWRLSKGDR